MKYFYTSLATPLGNVIMRSDGHVLTGFYFEGQKHMPAISEWQYEPSLPIFKHMAQQFIEYCNGSRKTFDVDYHVTHGTPFQQKVWHELLKIPYGITISYGALARALGSPQAVRAVGAAVGKNPLSVIVPCHRVVGSNGALTGYAGGLERKKNLLMVEKKSP